MDKKPELMAFVEEGLSRVRRLQGVREAEVFVSANAVQMTRLSFTTDLPCNGVEEPKSVQSAGVGVTLAAGGAGEVRVGHGYETGLSSDAVRAAIERARQSLAGDPSFASLPEEGGAIRRVPCDEELFSLDDAGLVDLGWRAVEGALERFAARGQNDSLIIGGDVSFFIERIAVGNTHGIRADDRTARAEARLTAMVESQHAKGTGWAVSATRLAFHPERAGADAADAALRAGDGSTVSDGTYDVVLGPQAVANILASVVLPSLLLSNVDSRSSPFIGKLGRQVAAHRVSLYDDGSPEGGAAARSVTCEGLATGRSDLIRMGILSGFLSNHYLSRKLEADRDGEEKLGVAPAHRSEALKPRNGFRFSPSEGRDYRVRPGIFATNLHLEVHEPVPAEELVRQVGRGLYIGRTWYTYPVNGLAAGDFTATVVGDSFLIEKGELTRPIRANTIRIEENLGRFLRAISGGTSTPTPTLLWATPHVAHVPAVALPGLRCRRIGTFLFDGEPESRGPSPTTTV